MNVSSPNPARGEVWYAVLDPVMGHEQGGERPCLIVSDDHFNRSRADLVVVVPITRTIRRVPTHVPVEAPEGGLKDVSSITCEHVRTISKLRLRAKWGKVSPRTLAAVDDRIRIVLNL